VSRDEFLTRRERFQICDVGGKMQWLDLEPGTLAFTICQVPVVLHAGGSPNIEVSAVGGVRKKTEGLSLDAETSATIFKRQGTVQRLDVHFGIAVEPNAAGAGAARCAAGVQERSGQGW
jgi:hypothetical protein